jgi:hypothetical protein
VKNKVNDSKQNDFESNFVKGNYKPSDLLWHEVSKNFETIMPIRKKEELQNDEEEVEEDEGELAYENEEYL